MMSQVNTLRDFSLQEKWVALQNSCLKCFSIIKNFDYINQILSLHEMSASQAA